MDEAPQEIVTLKPKWSVRDLIVERSVEVNRARILHQLNSQYISKGMWLEDNIIWGKDCSYAVVRLGGPSSN